MSIAALVIPLIQSLLHSTSARTFRPTKIVTERFTNKSFSTDKRFLVPGFPEEDCVLLFDVDNKKGTGADSINREASGAKGFNTIPEDFKNIGIASLNIKATVSASRPFPIS